VLERQVTAMTKFLHVLGFVILIAGLVMGGYYLADLRRSQAVAEELRQQVTSSLADAAPAESINEQSSDQASSDLESSQDATPMPATTPEQTLIIQENPFSDLLRLNTDLVGWLKIEDTRIDYPVVRGRDNDFYLNHGFDRKKNRAGTIFMDYRNIGDGSDRHTIIYGHKMKDQSMFYDLLLFRDPDFYEEHRLITLQTLYGPKQYRVFAAYTTKTDFYFIRTRFDEQSYDAFIGEIMQRSDFAWDTLVDDQDKLLTLVTCAHDFQDAHYVVHAVLIGD
jgi:sortase B